MRLQLDLFGPVRAWRGGHEMVLGSAQRRALLAVLALKANQVVTRPDLIDAIWGEKPPASAHGSIYTYVSSLRAALEPDRPQGGPGGVLTSADSGYCLRVDAESIDVVRFENLRERARLCQRANDLAGARAALDSALGLGKDEPLAGLPGPYAATQRERIRELQLDIVERRAKILLDEGEHQQVLEQLRPFAVSHPMREGLQNLHLLALYRCGYRDEALRWFERLRAGTVDELGVEPGSELTLRYEQIKADDATLWRGLTGTPQASTATRVPESTAPAGIFVGRARELAIIRSAIDGLADGRGASLWLEGEPGIGKSTLVSTGLATATGCTVARAGADELSRLVPLQVLLECLETGSPETDPRRTAVTRAVRRLASEVPADLAKAVDLILELVRTLCRERPLVLVLDDLHWADASTLEVWRRLADCCSKLPLVLIGLCRRAGGKHRLGQLRAELAAGGTTVHKLDSLDDDEVEDLIAGRFGAAPERDLLEIARTAAGNPLFVSELVDALAGEKPPEPAVRDARPVIPAAALDAISHRLDFLSAAASELLRWAALLDRFFTRADLAAALGRPNADFDDVLTEVVELGLVVRTGDKLTFRHAVVRETFYARTPPAFRLALHRQLGEALAEAGAPVERIASQLLAVPLQIDKWQCEWLAREIYALAAQSPLSAMRLVQRMNASNNVPAALREGLAIATVRITFWLERDLPEGQSPLTAQVGDPAVVAEMRWLLAYSRLVCGDAGQAAKLVKEALRDESIPAVWRRMHTALLSRTRVEWWPVCTTGDDDRAGRTPDHLTAPGADATDGFWRGSWDTMIGELGERLRGGEMLAKHTLSRPMGLRQLSGVAAVIAAHRGRPDDARAHLMSVWALPPADGSGADGTASMLAASAFLAELDDQPERALNLLSAMVEAGDVSACPWMPEVVRLAIELGEHDRAESATRLCERTHGYKAAALRCRALLEGDPVAALAAAARSRDAGQRFAAALAMEDAAQLFAIGARPVKASAALHAALRTYDQLGAVLDAERAEQRIRRAHHRAGR